MNCPVIIKAREEAFMRRAQVLQEIRNMEFERIYTGWKSKKCGHYEKSRQLIKGVKFVDWIEQERNAT